MWAGNQRAATINSYLTDAIMEANKNPACDIHRHKRLLFLTGLIISLILVILFRWKSATGIVVEKRVDPILNEPVFFVWPAVQKGTTARTKEDAL